jgi:hypothetical protein
MMVILLMMLPELLMWHQPHTHQLPTTTAAAPRHCCHMYCCYMYCCYMYCLLPQFLSMLASCCSVLLLLNPNPTSTAQGLRLS